MGSVQLVCESAVSYFDNHREMDAVKGQNDSCFTQLDEQAE